MAGAERQIRVSLLPFALPRYRVPVFRILASIPDMDVTVVYGRAPGLENVAASGFSAEPARVWNLRTPFGYVGWDASQWTHARPDRSDVLVLTWNTRYLSLVPSLLRARRKGVRTLLWGHGYSRRETAWRRRMRRIVASMADGVIFYGRRDADRYALEVGAPTGIYVAQNAIDQAPIEAEVARWSTDAEGLERFRESQGLGAGPVLLFVSRHKPANRIELLFEAASMLLEKYAGLRVVLVGDGLDAAPVVDEIGRLGIGDAVVFAGPQYDETRLAPWFLTADLFCYPSNLGLSALHAMGYGLPVVTGDDVSRHPPEREAVVDGVTGRTFSEGDARSMATVIDDLLADPAQRSRLGEAGRRLVRDTITIEEMAKGLEDAIRGVMERA